VNLSAVIKLLPAIKVGDFMRIVFFVLLISAWQTSALAECKFCAREVTLSETLAKCFIGMAKDEQARAEASGMDFYPINLGGCLDAGRNRAPNPFPIPRSGGQAKPLTTSFLVEPAAIGCLAHELSAENFSPEKIKTFRIVSDCGQ
jgi:hypothetical protein